MAKHKPPRRPLVLSKTKARSAITNGRDILPFVDGRSIIARRYRDILAQVTIDQGGSDSLSEVRLQLCRRFAAACVLAEDMEGRLARGQTISLQDHATLCSTLVRIARRIGVDRIARDVTPSLTEYLRRKSRGGGAAILEVEAAE